MVSKIFKANVITFTEKKKAWKPGWQHLNSVLLDEAQSQLRTGNNKSLGIKVLVLQDT
jgi:hypothetical protein